MAIQIFMPKKHFVIRGRKMQKKKTNVLSFEEGFILIKKLNSNAEIEKVECRRMLVKFVTIVTIPQKIHYQ